MRRRAWALAALALLGLSLAACGKRGPPVAPERRLPAAASGLRASVEGEAVVVSWTNPRSRVDGTRLGDLTTIKLHRREEAGGAAPKSAMLSGGQVVGYDEIASVSLEAPGPAVVRGNTVQWVDRTGLRFGRRYVYVVTALDSAGRSSAPSERLVVSYLAAPAAPRNPAAAAGEGQVRLRWDPPASLIDGGPLTGTIGYEILRAAGAEAPLAPVTPEPLTATSFTDTGLENETAYRYAIRAVRSEGGSVARGEASMTLAVTTVDMTPPGPPANLVAIPSPAAVRLSWSPSPDADVAVYAVYRAVGTGDFMRIGTTAAITTVFTDRDVTAGTRYRYAVTALDRARSPNESARSNEVTVQVP